MKRDILKSCKKNTCIKSKLILALFYLKSDYLIVLLKYEIKRILFMYIYHVFFYTSIFDSIFFSIMLLGIGITCLKKMLC